MAGKVQSNTKKTQQQWAEHDHVMDIAIAAYHADRDLGHLKPPRSLCRMTRRMKMTMTRPGRNYRIGNWPLYKGPFHSEITHPIACQIMGAFHSISL